MRWAYLEGGAYPEDFLAFFFEGVGEVVAGILRLRGDDVDDGLREAGWVGDIVEAVLTCRAGDVVSVSV